MAGDEDVGGNVGEEKEWGSVADPGCLSRIPDPDFYPSRIPVPKTATKERREKKISCHTFLCSHKFHKIVNYFSFKVLKKTIWANFQRIIENFSQKIVKKLLNMVLGSGIRDPRSGKNLFRIPHFLIVRNDFLVSRHILHVHVVQLLNSKQ